MAGKCCRMASVIVRYIIHSDNIVAGWWCDDHHGIPRNRSTEHGTVCWRHGCRRPRQQAQAYMHPFLVPSWSSCVHITLCVNYDVLSERQMPYVVRPAETYRATTPCQNQAELSLC